MTARQINIKCPVELAEMIDAVVMDSPFIGGRSALIRYGVELALADMVERDIVTDPTLKEQIRIYLVRSPHMTASVRS